MEKTEEDKISLQTDNPRMCYLEPYQRNGCNDPFWPDGCNMNLTRNHIISYKRDIAELCEKAGMSLPEEYFLKIPPEVDDNYMANLKQQARVDRLKQQGDKLSLKKQNSSMTDSWSLDEVKNNEW